MSTKAKKRVLADLRYYQTNQPVGITCHIHEDNILIWDACIIGQLYLVEISLFSPDDTPWEGGCFFLRIEMSESYPDTVPSIRFITPMFHPNSILLYFCS